MDVPRADPPQLQALEVSSRPSEQDEEWHTALNLHARFTSKPGSTLTIVDLGSEFDISIQHVSIYKVPNEEVDPVDDSILLGRVDYSNSILVEKGSSGPKLSQHDESEKGEASKVGEEENPRKLYTQGMGLSPSPSRMRLFPPSPSSAGGQGASRQLGPDDDYDNDNKENKTPDDDLGDTGHLYTRHQQLERTDTTAVHSSLLRAASRGRTMARQADQLRRYEEEQPGEEHEEKQQEEKQQEEEQEEKEQQEEEQQEEEQQEEEQQEEWEREEEPEEEQQEEEQQEEEPEEEQQEQQEQHEQQRQERQEQRQPLTGDVDDAIRPVPILPPALVPALDPGGGTDVKLQTRSRIPVRSSSSINLSEADPPRIVESSPIAKSPGPLSPFPDIPPEILNPPEREQPNSDPEPISARGNPDPLDVPCDLQSEEKETKGTKEGERLRAALEGDSVPEQTKSSLVGEWLRDGQAEEFDSNPEVSPERQKSEDSSGAYYSASGGNDNGNHQDREMDHGTTLSEHQSRPEDDSIALPSPSSASKRSMPWNSAEQIALKAKSTISSEAEEPSSSQKVIDWPELDNSKGQIYVRFPENIEEALFICHATVHLRVSSLDAAKGRSIAIICSIAQVEKVAYNWGARSEPMLALPAVTTISLVDPVSEEDRNKEPKNIEKKEAKEPSRPHKNDDTQTGSQTESKINGDWKRTLRRIAGALGWVDAQFSRLVVFLSWLKQQWHEFAAVGERREIDARPEPLILKCALIALVCSTVVSTVNWHCNLNSSEQRYYGSPGYYRQDSRNQFSLCSMWLRGGDAIKCTVESFLSDVAASTPEHDEAQTAETGAVNSQQSEQEEPAQEEDEVWITPRMSQRPVSPAETGKEERDDGILRDLSDQYSDSTEAEELDENAGHGAAEHETGEENAAEQSAGDGTPSLRDRIDWFLGWKGPVECPAAGYRCP